MTRTTTIARTLKRQAVLLALAACLVAQTTEATAATRPEQLGSHKQRPEAGIIVQAGIIQSGWSRVSARSVPAAGIIQQRRPESGVIAQSGIIVTRAGQRRRPETGVIQQRRA